MEHKKSCFTWNFLHEWMRLYKWMLMRLHSVQHSGRSLMFPSCVSWPLLPYINISLASIPKSQTWCIHTVVNVSIFSSNSQINATQIWKKTSDNWGPVNLGASSPWDHSQVFMLTAVDSFLCKQLIFMAVGSADSSPSLRSLLAASRQ